MRYETACFYAPLARLPVVITGPGKYLTRSAEVVEVAIASQNNDHGCTGRYANGVEDRWHRSGRIYSGIHSGNDIIQSA